jgi:outer membrane protein
MRKMLKKLRWTIALAALLGATSVSAQVGLLEIYQLAESNDPILRQAESNYRATSETKPQARSALLPSITLGASDTGRYSESRGPQGFGVFNIPGAGSVSRSNSNDVSLNVSQTIFDLSRIRTLKQADKIVTQAELNLESTRQELLVRVANAYFNVLSAEELLAAETASREAIGRQLEQAQRRFDVGLIAITDVQQAQAAYDNSVAVEIGAQRSLSTTQEFLREIIGEYVTNLRGPGEELPLLRPDPSTADEWVGIAMRQNLTLAASRVGTDIAQDNIRILRAARMPTLSLNGGFSSGDQFSRNTQLPRGVCDPNDPVLRFNCPVERPSENDSRNWSLNLNIPIYTGGFNGSRVQQAVHQHRAAQQDMERIARQTERETRDAYLGVIAEISRVEALRQAVESNRTALRATEAGFEVGTQTTVDVLAAQDNLRRAETNYAISRYDYIINLLTLRRAAGNLAVADFELVDTWFE